MAYRRDREALLAAMRAWMDARLQRAMSPEQTDRTSSIEDVWATQRLVREEQEAERRYRMELASYLNRHTAAAAAAPASDARIWGDLAAVAGEALLAATA